MKSYFRKFAEQVSLWVGSASAFFAALAILVVWAVAGPIFNFSEQWQLTINSFTTIVTFLMVFIIQNTQNRDFRALQLKLDALLSAADEPHAALVNLHKFSDEDLQRIERALQRTRSRHNIESIIESLESFADENSDTKVTS